MRENIANGEVPFRKAYLRAVIDRIEVDDRVGRVIGDTATLEQVVAGKGVPRLGFAIWYASGAPLTSSYSVDIHGLNWI